MYFVSKDECEVCPLNKTCDECDSENCLISKSISNAFNAECLNNYDEGYRAGLQKAREMCDRDALLQISDYLYFFANDAYKDKQDIHPLIIIKAVKRIREACGVKQ